MTPGIWMMSATCWRDWLKPAKIRHYGWCTWPGNTEGAKVFAGRKGCTAIQYRLNVLEDAPDMLNLCEDNELASISLAPLAMSLLTGKYNAESKFPENDVRHGWDLTGGQQANSSSNWSSCARY